MWRMTEYEVQDFLERISATTIVNQAAFKCLSLGIPLKPENVEFFVGDFFDPEKPELAGLLDRIRTALNELKMVQTASLNS